MRRSTLTALVALGLTLLPGPGRASSAEAGARDGRFIGPGREADVLALLRPFTLSAEVVPGVTVHRVSVEGRAAVVTLRDAAGATASLRLAVRDEGEGSGAGAPAFRVERPRRAVSGRLEEACERVAAAVTRNDDGSFFGAAPPTASGPGPEPARRAPPAGPGLPLGLAYGAWGILLLVLLAEAIRAARRRLPWSTVAAGGAVLAVALAVRLLVPYAPLHANSHAYEDIAVALAVPDAAALTREFLALYGPSWWAGQRLGLLIAGAHHAGLANVDVVFGALAALLAFAAALRNGAGRVAALVAALVAAAVPIAARVGHSESPFAVAQLLVAAALLLGASRGRLATLGHAAAVALLATGHLIGPPLAAATVLVGWAAAPSKRDRVATGPGTGASPGRALLVGLALTAGGAALVAADRLGPIREHFGGRLASLSPATKLLWIDPAWSSLALAAAVVLGVVGCAWPAAAGERPARVAGRAAAALVGLTLAVVSGLLVVACVSDALRYQAPAAALIVVLAARAPALVPRAPGARRRLAQAALGLLAAVAIAEVSRVPSGATWLDVQAREYEALRAALLAAGAEVVVLVEPERPIDEKMLKLPVGRLGPDGPTVRLVPAAQIGAFCRPDERPFVFVSAEAAIAPAPGGGSVADHLLALADHGEAHLEGVAPSVALPRLRSEFHREMPETARWSLWRARCP